MFIKRICVQSAFMEERILLAKSKNKDYDTEQKRVYYVMGEIITANLHILN